MFGLPLYLEHFHYLDITRIEHIVIFLIIAALTFYLIFWYFKARLH